MDPETNKEVPVSFDELKGACSEVMRLPEDVAKDMLGKPNYRNDPTYNLRRKK